MCAAREAGLVLDYLRFRISGSVHGAVDHGDDIATGFRIESTATRGTG